jgi:hypothetical protein
MKAKPGASIGGGTSEMFRSGRAVLTPHSIDSYPGLRVIRPGRWDLSLILPRPGQTIVALGGERTIAYETVDGGRAQGFELREGDQAHLIRSDLEYCLAEWQIERAQAQPKAEATSNRP